MCAATMLVSLMGLANSDHISSTILVQLITGDLDEGIMGRHIIAPKDLAPSEMQARVLALGPHAVIFMAILLAITIGLRVCEDAPRR